MNVLKMTNIGGAKFLKKNREEGEEFEEYLFFIADSMASSRESQSKWDYYQKMFVVGENKDFILMGTGRGDWLTHLASKLENEPLVGLEDTYQQILFLTQNIPGINHNECLNLIIGGYHILPRQARKTLGILHMNATGWSPDEGKSRPENIGARLEDFVFDGSGSGNVISYLDGLHETGKIYVDDLADVLVYMYEFGKQGAKNMGVNDKLQLGILTKNGSSVLYHPDIRLAGDNQFTFYLNQMCSAKLPVLGDDVEGKERIELGQARQDLKKVLSQVYCSLISDLREYAELRSWYTSWSEAYAANEKFKECFDNIRERRAKARGHVTDGVNALVNRGLDSLVSYLKDCDLRQRVVEARAVEHIQKYAPQVAKQ